MKQCAYCGRQNEEASVHCRECGTEFPSSKAAEPEVPPHEPERPPHEPDRTPLASAVMVDLSTVPEVFVLKEGFSRPNWKAIAAAIEGSCEPEDREAAWREAVLQWVDQMTDELGGPYRAQKSRDFVLLSPLPEEGRRRILDFSQRALDVIRHHLREVAWGKHSFLHVIIMFQEEDDYFQYISGFHKEGTHPASSGIQIRSGYPHIALRYQSEADARSIIAHEMAHHCVAHLPLPRWLDEGIAQTIERAVSGYTGSFLPDEVLDGHRRFWNEARIQGFWAGTSFQEPGDSVRLSYSLADILVHLITEDFSPNPESFLAFVGNAHHDDGGQTAALDCLGTCLGKVAETFLGSGDWRPRRKALKACWEARAGGAGDVKKGEGEAEASAWVFEFRFSFSLQFAMESQRPLA